MSKETDAARNRAKRKKQAIRRAGDALTLKGDYGKSGVQAAVKKNRVAPGKIVKNKDTKEVKRETRTAGYSGAKGDSGLPPRHSKNEMGTSGSKERAAQARAKPASDKAKDTAASKAKAKKKTSSSKAKSDKFDFNKAINKGFGRVY